MFVATQQILVYENSYQHLTVKVYESGDKFVSYVFDGKRDVWHSRPGDYQKVKASAMAHIRNMI